MTTKKKKSKQISHGESVKGIKKEDREIPKNAAEAEKTFPWMGRYHEGLPDQLIQHMGTGKSFESFGSIAKASYSTLKRWANEYPAFKEAREIGESMALNMVENFAISKIRGKIVLDAEQREQFNPKLADTQMIMFLLRTRHHKIYSEKQDVNHRSDDGSMTPKQSVIILPSNGRTKEENE